jgi:hypothetical protein
MAVRVLRQSSTRLYVQIATEVGRCGRGAATLHRTSSTVIGADSVVSSSQRPPPSTNRSICATSLTTSPSASTTSSAATMRHTLFASDAINRTRPVPPTRAVTSTSPTAVHRCQYVAWKRPQ